MAFYTEQYRQFLELALLRELQHGQGHILHTMERMMSKISDFGTAMTTYFDEQSTATDELKTGLDGLKVDVDWMKARIDELQNNPGPISPEDQAILDALSQRAAGAVTRAKESAAQAKELDDRTPPVVPPEVLKG